MSAGIKNILVVDDHKETRELITEILRKKGFFIIAAPGGREALQVAKIRKIDLILLDMNMPHYDGLQTCKALKRIPMTKNIPVIFLTANRDPENIKMAIKAGGIDYIAKPFDPDAMVERISKHLKYTGFDRSNVIKNS